MGDDDSPDLHRYWIEFLIPAGEHPKRAPGKISLDGGSVRFRYLHQGVGATGYDLNDCLKMIADMVDAEAPEVAMVVADPDLSGPEWDWYLARSGSPAWRGIWFPLFHDGPRFLSGSA